MTKFLVETAKCRSYGGFVNLFRSEGGLGTKLSPGVEGLAWVHEARVRAAWDNFRQADKDVVAVRLKGGDAVDLGSLAGKEELGMMRDRF